MSAKTMDKRGGGSGRREVVSRFSLKKSLSHSTKRLRRWNLLGFRKFLVLKIFLLEGEGKNLNNKFASTIFCSTVLKNFLREPFSVSG